MTTTDWIIDIALILIVLRQLREEPLTRRTWLIPLVLVGYTASHYFKAIPTAGNDLVVIVLLGLVGATLGVAGGFTTKVRGVDGTARIRAGKVAAGLWVGSMTARLGFIIWITHSGQASLASFSIHHDITGASTWQDALLIMALSEVVLRIGIILVRGHRAAEASRLESAAASQPLTTV